MEEKLLVQAMEARGLAYDLIDVRKAVFDLRDPRPWRGYDVIFERCVSHTKAMGALQFLGTMGIPCVNNAHVAQVCGSKLETSLALVQAGVPTPQVKVAFSTEAALAHSHT